LIEHKFIDTFFDKYQMPTEFVKIKFDVYCDWTGTPPVYRIYVNDELFVERTYIWPDQYLTEVLQIQAPVGQYRVKLKSMSTNPAKIRTLNHAVEYGTARWIDHKTIEITDAS
jgi:hypothetical protein